MLYIYLLKFALIIMFFADVLVAHASKDVRPGIGLRATAEETQTTENPQSIAKDKKQQLKK